MPIRSTAVTIAFVLIITERPSTEGTIERDRLSAIVCRNTESANRAAEITYTEENYDPQKKYC